MVRILVLSFLFKGDSFSFVRGLWLLDLINRKTFLWIFFGSPLHLVFFDGDWKIDCFLAFVYLLWDLYFLETLSCLQAGDFNLGVFAGAPQLAWLGCILYQGVFISINAIYDFILLFFCSIWSSFLTHQIWYGWRLLCRREGALASLGKSFHIEASFKSSQIDQEGIDHHHHQGIYKVF